MGLAAVPNEAPMVSFPMVSFHAERHNAQVDRNPALGKIKSSRLQGQVEPSFAVNPALQ